MFPTQEPLQAPILTLRESSGLVSVLQLAALFPAPAGLSAECPRSESRRHRHAGPRPSQHRHDFVATVSEYSCYG